MKYHAFISYSHRDKAWGDWLHKALETYKVPKALVGQPTTRGEPVPARVFPVFRDREELPTSTSLRTAIKDALEQSRYLIVICSPNSAQSLWVNKEILEYKRLGREDRVLAIVVEGTPNATDRDDPIHECFPPALRFRLGPDGELSTERTEPIAADARPHADGKQNALLKLLAGVLGANYDDLRQRDAARRRQRLRFLVAASIALTLAFATLALAALIQRNEAIDQRERAQQQEARAVAARKQAESILSFLLVDLRDQLVPVGRHDIIEKVQARVDDYYQELAVDSGDTQQLQQRAAALTNEGEDARSQGQLTAAQTTLEAALAIRRELAVRMPLHTGWQRNIAAILDEIGDIESERLEMGDALARYEEALQIRRKLTTQTPANSTWQSDLAASMDRMGEFHRTHGRLSAAVDALEDALRIRRTLVQREPGNSIWQANLATTLILIGRTHHAQKRLTASQEDFDEALQILRALTLRDPQNFSLQIALAAALESAGETRLAEGDPLGTLLFFDEALTIRRALIQHDLLNRTWQKNLAILLSRTGQLRFAQNEPATAAPLLQSATESYHALIIHDPDNTELVVSLAQALDILAEAQLALKNIPSAVAALDECTRVYRDLTAQKPADTQAKKALVVILMKGATWAGAGTQEKARIAQARLTEALALTRNLEQMRALTDEEKDVARNIASSIRRIRSKWNLPAQPKDDPLLANPNP